MRPLAYENLIPENRDSFCEMVIQIASRLGINPNWLMIVFFIETYAVKFKVINHKIKNSIGAVGLFQFLPNTALRLGTSTTALAAMSNVKQLEYVYKYLSPYTGRMKCLGDVYLAVLFPAAIGKPDNWVLQAGKLTPEKVARFNPLYDINKNGQLTVLEVKTKVQQFVPAGFAL